KSATYTTVGRAAGPFATSWKETSCALEHPLSTKPTRAQLQRSRAAARPEALLLEGGDIVLFINASPFVASDATRLDRPSERFRSDSKRRRPTRCCTGAAGEMDSYEHSSNFPLAFPLRGRCQVPACKPVELSRQTQPRGRSITAANLALGAAAQILE